MGQSKKNHVDRRTFIRGAGIALALPWLETFASDSSGDKSPMPGGAPRRFVSIYHPDGVGLPLKDDPAWRDWSWFPRGGERDFELTKVLDVLEPLRGEMTIYSGLSHPAVRRVHGHSNADQYLTGAATGGGLEGIVAVASRAGRSSPASRRRPAWPPRERLRSMALKRSFTLTGLLT